MTGAGLYNWPGTGIVYVKVIVQKVKHVLSNKVVEGSSGWKTGRGWKFTDYIVPELSSFTREIFSTLCFIIFHFEATKNLVVVSSFHFKPWRGTFLCTESKTRLRKFENLCRNTPWSSCSFHARIKTKSFLLGPLEFSKNMCRKWILIGIFVVIIYRTIIGESKNLQGGRERAFVAMGFFAGGYGQHGGLRGGWAVSGRTGSKGLIICPTENLEYCPEYSEDILKKIANFLKFHFVTSWFLENFPSLLIPSKIFRFPEKFFFLP